MVLPWHLIGHACRRATCHWEQAGVWLSLTEGSEVAFAGDAALVPGDGVVQVAAGGGPAAARRGAPGAAGADQVLEFAAGPVAGLGVGVVAVAAGDRDHVDAQAAQVVLRAGAD